MQNTIKGVLKQTTKINGFQSLPKAISNDFKLVHTHLIDGIYQGFVNSSYQRDGFGILQTDKFETYIGFFRYNKIHGKGMIIYPDGSIIYGHFTQGKLDGIALTDTPQQFQIGTFREEGMIGIGFQYNYSNQTWKMNRYHKYVAIQTLKEQKNNIEDQIPSLFRLQPLILDHFLRYKSKKLFLVQNQKPEHLLNSMMQDINTFYFHQISQQKHFYGALIDEKYEALGLFYDQSQKKVTEAGTYRNGLLDGYGIKININNNDEQIGLFYKGKKTGIFCQKKANKLIYVHYQQEQKYFQEARGYSIQMFEKAQKIYNYKQKDFVSLRHGIEFGHKKCVFETGEYKAWKLQLINDSKKQVDVSPNKIAKQIKSKSKNANSSSTLAGYQQFQKSSLIIMKEKIYSFTAKKKKGSMIGQQKKNSKNVKIIENLDEKMFGKARIDDQLSEEEIAVEENPIETEPKYSKKKSFNFKTDKNY